jgi:hypothetical protein
VIERVSDGSFEIERAARYFGLNVGLIVYFERSVDRIRRTVASADVPPIESHAVVRRTHVRPKVRPRLWSDASRRHARAFERWDMQGSKPRRLRFVVGSVLLVSAPMMPGCSEVEPPMVNTRPLPPNPVGTEEPPPEPPTMEGVGVPLPTPNTVAHPPPTPNTVAQPEDPTEGVGEAGGEVRANPVPEPVIRANPGPAERDPIGQ